MECPRCKNENEGEVIPSRRDIRVDICIKCAKEEAEFDKEMISADDVWVEKRKKERKWWKDLQK